MHMLDAGFVAATSAFLVAAAAVAIGPTPIAMRVILRAFFGAETNRQWYRAVTLGAALGMIVAVGLAGWRDGDDPVLVALYGLLFLLAIVDWRWRWLPIEWTVAVIALAVVSGFYAGMIGTVLVQMIVPAALFFLMRLIILRVSGKEALGLGDVWLMAGLGGFLSVFSSFLVIGLAALTGLFEVVLRGWFGKKGGQQVAVSYGTHLCIVFVIAHSF